MLKMVLSYERRTEGTVTVNLKLEELSAFLKLDLEDKFPKSELKLELEPENSSSSL